MSYVVNVPDKQYERYYVNDDIDVDLSNQHSSCDDDAASDDEDDYFAPDIHLARNE